MVHMICDGCGKDCGQHAYAVELTPLMNLPNNEKSSVDSLRHDKAETKLRLYCAACMDTMPLLGNAYVNYKTPVVSYPADQTIIPQTKAQTS